MMPPVVATPSGAEFTGSPPMSDEVDRIFRAGEGSDRPLRAASVSPKDSIDRGSQHSEITVRRVVLQSPEVAELSSDSETAEGGVRERGNSWQNFTRKFWKGWFVIGKKLEIWNWRRLGSWSPPRSRGASQPSGFGLFGSDNRLLRQGAIVAFWTFAWYLCSLFLTASNRLVFVSLGFPYPLAVTFINFAGCALISRALAMYCVRDTETRAVSVDKRTYITAILPISVCCAVEVALTNQAISMVSLSVITVIKSTLVAATYAVAILAGIEQLHKHLALILLWIISSVALSVPGMEIENPLGIILLGLAVLLAAVRWVLVHKQLVFSDLSSLDLIAITQPLAALCLLPASLLYDAPDMIETILWEPADSPHTVAVFSLVALGVLFACALLFAEFRLIEHTSSLTLTVAGVGKECLTIAMSTAVFKETLQWRAVLGLASSIAGITAYGYVRSKMNLEVAELPERDSASPGILAVPEAELGGIELGSIDAGDLNSSSSTGSVCKNRNRTSKPSEMPTLSRPRVASTSSIAEPTLSPVSITAFETAVKTPLAGHTGLSSQPIIFGRQASTTDTISDSAVAGDFLPPLTDTFGTFTHAGRKNFFDP